jgi:2-methylcitrate dehydratase PrpD
VVQDLGRRCYFTETGIEIKKYPCCGSAHLALDATARLLERESIEASEIDRIAVMVDFDPPRSLIHSRPKQGLEGKFSMNYCLAAAFLDRNIGLRTFTDEQVQRPEAQALIPKIEMVRISGYEGQPSWVEAYNEVEVHMRDGRVLRERKDRPTEGALRGTTLDDIRNKFRDCASLALPPAATQEIIGLLDNLEDVEDTGTLADLLRGDG